mmetsp:Transcript_22113/g.65580  ORF Transcript_22113/g.65580 Transcript_22113/m.65580 type:complete len:367 (-) Transcript_22113:1120-2220(-)
MNDESPLLGRCPSSNSLPSRSEELTTKESQVDHTQRRRLSPTHVSDAHALLSNTSNSENLTHVRPLLIRFGSSFFEPFRDESGSSQSVRGGLSSIAIAGTILGVFMPKNATLPTPWYRVVSSMLGYTYFLAWSVSFYPQIVANYQRGSTVGLSSDFSTINHVGYICYSIYTTSFFWSQDVNALFKERYGQDAKITVQSNDVAFALHALVLSFVWVFQIFYFGGFKMQGLTLSIRFAIVGITLICSGVALSIKAGWTDLSWLDFLYLLSLVKVLITITKYVPQVLLNIRRKSTVGWSIWNVTLDVMGGSLSMMQLVLDSVDLEDWTGITGNLAKLGLSVVTIVFDAIFLFQHYVLYRHSESGSSVVV